MRAGGGLEDGEVRVHLAVGDLVAEAFEEVEGIVDAGLREAKAVFGEVWAEEGDGLGLEEVAEVFGEDHGDAREVAESGYDAAGFELGEKAGGEAGVAAELEQAHGFFEAQVADAGADALLGDEGFGFVAVDAHLGDVGGGEFGGLGVKLFGGFEGFGCFERRNGFCWLHGITSIL